MVVWRKCLAVRPIGGYESEASFSRAFKRFMGVPPSSVRRSHRSVKAPAALPSRGGRHARVHLESLRTRKGRLGEASRAGRSPNAPC
ncbi:MAG: hypothetical protein GEU99_14540 [Luteitalea sp.]|nr:hypothetical protein [Luteitalea sp.]